MSDNRPPPWPDGAVIYHRPTKELGWYTGKWIAGDVVVMKDVGTHGINSGNISETWWRAEDCEGLEAKHLRVVKGGKG